MRRLHLSLGILTIATAAACVGKSPMPGTPSSVPVATFAEPPAPPGPCAIGYEGLSANRAAFTTHKACGLEIAVTAGTWEASTTYGQPAPFVQFLSPAGTLTTGEITVSGAGATFAFTSVDIYSSTTRIPFEITGLAGLAPVFTLQGEQGNTFGRFATIAVPGGTAQIDTLRIRLKNPAAPCCANPVGLDNIRVVR